MRPPRTAELILRSLGASVTFSEPMIGDLAEDFARRLESDGAAAARWWYYKEAVRATPHLLRDCARSMRLPDIRRLAGIVLTSWVFAIVSLLLLAQLLQGTLDALGLSPHLRFGHFPRTQVGILWYPAQMISIVMTGYFAAWLDTRAPVVTAMVAGVALSLPALVIAIAHASVAGLFLGLAALIQFALATLGGVLRARIASV